MIINHALKKAMDNTESVSLRLFMAVALNFTSFGFRRGSAAVAPKPIVCRLTQVLAVVSTDTAHLVDNVVNVENHFHHTDLFLVDRFVKLCLYLRLANMKYRESQRDPCQRTGKSRVTGGDRLSCETGRLTLSCTQKNDNVLRAILIGEVQNTLLVFQIHCTCGSSNEALCRGKDNLGTGSDGTGLNGGAGNTVAVADSNDLFPC